MSAHDNPVQVLLLDKSHDRIGAELARRVPAADVIRWHPDGQFSRGTAPVSRDEIAPTVGWVGSDILSGRHVKAYGEVLKSCASLRWIQSANAGLDLPIYAALASAGVRMSKSGAQSIPIAEYVLAYALEHRQGLAARRAAQAAGQWQAQRFAELWHATWLLVGYGHIGQGVARRAQAFDSHVIALRASGAAHEFADEVATLDALADYLPRADIVLLACPATDATRGIANGHFFEQLKPGALFINVARGSLVDETALLAGLERDQPAHAVMDVFQTEPLPADSPLWAHPKVSVTAHTSNAGSGTRLRGDELFLANLERFAAGAALLDEVDPASIA